MNAPANLGTVNVHEAKTNFSRLLERARAGEEIVIAKAGVPMARLVPLARDNADPMAKPGVETLPPRRPGRYKGLLSGIPDSVWFDPLPDDELDAWEGKYSNIV